jgi:long-chain acyl-CoA synthetase
MSTMAVPTQLDTVADFVLLAGSAPGLLGAAGGWSAGGGADGDRVVLVDGRRRLTWAELDRAVRARAAGLRQLGLQAGDRVVLQLGTGTDFVEVYLGALHAGLVVVPVNPAYTAPELGYVLTDCAARALVTSSLVTLVELDRLRAEVPSLEFVISVGGPDSGDGVLALASIHAATELPAMVTDPEAIGVILYTSGTSGRPKGAMLSHRALLANVEHVVAIEPPLLGADDIVFLPVPLSHIFGLNAALAPALALGATTVLNDRFDPARTLELISAEGVTVVVGAPSMFAAWSVVTGVAEALRGVRLALSGSAPLPPVLVARFAEIGVALHEGYGMTEAAPVVALNVIGADGTTRIGHPKAGSVGSPPPGVDVQLRGADGDTVDDDDSGEVAVRGANLFSGYWPDGRDGPDEDGWFVTGDLAYRDDDGDLVLVGRDSELVLVNGFNVYPAEVESVLTALDGVSAAAVVGVPDPSTGESLRAYVVAEPDRDLDPAELLAGAALSLARFKLPKRVDVVETLPYTLTGKVKKWQLQHE